MKAKRAPDAWLFDVEKAPLFAAVIAEDGRSGMFEPVAGSPSLTPWRAMRSV